MIETAAVRVALSLLHLPSAIRRVKAEPLPAGVDVLLQVVAGDAAVQREAATRTERPVDMIREAAEFFVEQILLAPESGSYRILGAAAEAPASELRHNMALLLRWLHPDKMQTDDRRALVERVTLAWENLKTPERRASYDRQQQGQRQPSKASGRRHRSQNMTGPPTVGHNHRTRNGKPSLLRRALYLLLGR